MRRIPDTPPRLINKKAGEKSLAPVRDRGLTVKEQRILREQGRPDLADAQYDSTGKQWLLPTNQGIDPSRIDPSRVSAADGQGWVSANVPSGDDKSVLNSAMSPETRGLAPVPTWGAFMERNPELRSAAGQEFLGRHPGIDGQSIKPPPPSSYPTSPSGDVFDIGGQTAPSGALGGSSGGMMSGINTGLGALSSGLDAIKPSGLEIDDVPTYGNPIRESALSKARAKVRMMARGGRLRKDETAIVGEEGPELITRHGDAVDVVPLQEGAERSLMPSMGTADARQLSAEEFYQQNRTVRPDQWDVITSDGTRPKLSAEAARYKNAEPFGLGHTEVENQMVRPSVNGGGLLSNQDTTTNEEPAPPRIRPWMEIMRELANDPNDTSSKDVWNAREMVDAEKAYDLMNQPVKRRPWLDFGMKLLTSVNNQLNSKNDPVQGWGEMQRDAEMAKLAPRLELYKRRKAEQDAREKADLDRKLQTRRLQDYDDDEKFRRDQLQQGALKQIVGLKHFDPNNPIHAEIARKAGRNPQDLVGWDDRNPFTKKIGGREYQWTGKEFKPVNVPDNELVDYNVETLNADGTKTVKSFKVPKSDAVKFATQLNVLGLQSELAMKKQDDAQRASVDLERIRQEGRAAAERLQAVLAEEKASKDDARKSALQKEAADLRIKVAKSIEDYKNGVSPSSPNDAKMGAGGVAKP